MFFTFAVVFNFLDVVMSHPKKGKNGEFLYIL